MRESGAVSWRLVDLAEVPQPWRRTQRWIPLVQSFAETGEAAAELFLNGMPAKTASSGLIKATHRLGVPVRVVRRRDRLFLIRKGAS